MRGRAYSVEQVNKYIRGLFDNEPFLQDVRVKGEISNLKYHSSGHIYFDIKDSSGKLSCAMFRAYRKGLGMTLHEGDGIIATGDISVYIKNGTYQLLVRRIEAEGEGDLYTRFERLKQELGEMGMFSPEYKKPLPPYVFHLGIVTAPTGAAVQDMIRIARRRNPMIRITLYPAKVQGEGAAESIVAGIEALNELGVEAIIAGRGGGSIEDLWAFNEEIVARAIFASEAVVVSAVGHETDTTIADFVADVRAATPSEAAELVVCEYDEIIRQLSIAQDELRHQMERRLQEASQWLDRMEEKLALLHPTEKLAFLRRTLANSKVLLRRAMENRLKESWHRLELCAGALDGMSPMKRMSDGYAWLSDEKGNAIRSVSDVEKKEKLHARLKDGRLTLAVEEITNEKR